MPPKKKRKRKTKRKSKTKRKRVTRRGVSAKLASGRKIVLTPAEASKGIDRASRMRIG